jgi:hypothetical protein
MKFAGSTFFVLLLGIHGAGDLDRLLGKPLSQFRDAELGWMGYALFAVLLLVGALYVRALWRARREPESIVAGLAVVLLVGVVVTPSWGFLHHVFAFTLFALLFGYYTLLLHRARSAWLLGHLAAPFLLVVVTGCHSYGLWQKAFILYCVAAAVLHHHLLGRPARESSRTPQRGQTLRRRKVYTLEQSRSWARRGAARSAT